MARQLLICIALSLFSWMAKGQDYQYLKTFSQSVSPTRMAMDNSGFLWVCLPAYDQVVKLNPEDGTLLNTIGQQGVSGKTNDLLNNPSDIDVDGAGNIYIADKGNNRVIHYNAQLNYQWEIDLGAYVPESITIGPDGKLYICYSGSSVGVLIYNQTTLEQTITALSTDKFRNPLKIRFDNTGQLFIVDRNTGIIKVSGFNSGHALVSRIIKKEDGLNVLIKCEDLTFTSKGSTIVTSNQDNADLGLYQGLYRFDINGLFAGRIGLTGAQSSNEGFNAPEGIVCDQNNNIYVADFGNMRIQVWKAIDNQAPEIRSFNIENVTVSDMAFSFELNEEATFYGLVLEEGSPQPGVADIITPSAGSISFNTNYILPNQPLYQTVNNLSAEKNYIVYYVARDLSGNTTSVNASPAFSTAASIKHLVCSQKQATQASFNVNGTLEGHAYYCLEQYNGQAPTHTTTQQIKDAPNMLSFRYAPASQDQQFTVQNLTEDTPYRISLFIENDQSINTPVMHYIFRSEDDIERIHQHYREWCIGNSNVDYSNSIINARYLTMLANGEAAIANLPLYDVNNPGETYDLVNNSTHISHIRALVRNTLFPLALIYNIQGPADQPNPYYQDPQTREQVLGLFRYLSARGFLEGCNSEFRGGGVYLGLTSYFYASMLMKTELDKAGLLQEVTDNMAWWTRWELIGLSAQPWSYEQKSALKQADFVRTFYHNHFITLLTQPDSNLDKALNMAYLADVYNEACQISYGWGGFIKPDYTGYHHHGIWGSAYITEALHLSSLMCMLTSGTPYAYSPSAVDNLSQAMLAYRYYCNKYDNPKSICGRFPANEGDLLLNMPAFAYLQQVNNNTYKTETGNAFKRLWNAPSSLLESELSTDVMAYIQFRGGLGGLQQMVSLGNEIVMPEDAPTGNRVFPYGNMQVHRRGEWMVAVKGYSKYVWDYESNGEQNWFGRNQSAGALEIFGTDDTDINGVTAKASGWNEAGYDWDHVPGTTTFDLPNWSDHDKDYIWAKFSPEYFVGGVSLNQQNGVFAMKYVDVRETGWVQRDYKLRARKSYFFFDDQIVCLGSDIESIHPSYPVHTTLFQNYLSDISKSSSVNGTSYTGTSLDYVHPDNSSAYLTDVTGNSYFVRDASQMHVSRQVQSSRDNRDVNDTQGNFAKAWIDHTSAGNTSYEYLVWVQSPESNIATLASNPDAWYKVEQKDATAHVVTHVKKQMTGYAIFEANKVIDKGVVYSTNNDCIIMHSNTEQGINLSVAHPDLGWLAKDKSLYQVWSVNDDTRWLKPVEQPVEITLKGHWQMPETHPSITVLGYDANANRTRILFQCLDGQSLEVPLVPGTSTDINQPGNNQSSLFPNPAKESFNVQLQTAAQKMEIITVYGKVIATYNNLSVGTHHFNCLKDKGSYVVRISGKGIIETHKLVML